MKNKLTGKQIGLAALSLLSALVMLAGVSATPALANGAPPPIPQQFYGFAYISGSLAPVGATVTANIDGVQVGTTTVVTGTTWTYSLICGPATTPTNPAITFYINGVQATETATFSSGAAATVLNLHTGATPTLAVTTGTASSITAATAVLGGNLTSKGSDSSVNVSFEYGATTSYGTTTSPVTVTATGAYSASISGLAASTLYYFRAKAVGSLGGTVYGSQGSFTTLSSCTAPLVTTGASSSVTSASASVCATVACLCTSGSTTLCFDYGPTTAYGSVSSCQTVTTAGNYCATISGLSASTTYYYRAKLTCASGTVYGSQGSFTTSAASSGGCSTSCCYWAWGTAYLNNSPAYYATITAYANGTQAATAQTDYQGAYSIYVPVTSGATVTFAVSGNAASETATGSCMGTSSNFNLHAYNSVLGVTTGTGAATSSTTATLNGTLTGLGANPSALVYFQYGLTTAYGSTTPTQSMAAVGTFTADIAGLSPSTTYHFRANATGAATPGSDGTFTTTTPQLSVSTVAASAVSTTSATMNGNLLDLGSDTTANVSFNYGLTTSLGTSTTPQGKTATGSFSASLAGLTPGTIYYYRANASGVQSAQTVYGSTLTFTTGSAPSGCSSNCCHWFWGTAYLNGTALNTGTVIALVNGSQAATTTTTSSGGYNFYVPVTSGATVTFTVGGATATQSVTGQCMGYNGSYNLYATTGTVSVSTGSSTYATATTAILSGSLGSLGSDSSATVSLEYGTSTAYGSTTTTTSMTSTGAFTGGASGLTAGTTYYFRAKGVGSPSGAIVYGSAATYVHNAGGTLSVTTGSGSYASSTTATLSSTLAGLASDISATCYIDYGLTTGYGSSTSGTTLTSTGGYSATASALVAGQTYHIRGRVVGSPSGATAYGSDVTYVHSSGGTLAVSTTGGTYATVTTATFAGSLTGLGTDTAATVSFEYGTSTAYGSATSTSSVSSIGGYAITATGLTSGTTYHMRAKAVGSPSSSTVYGSDVTYVHSPGTCGSDPVGCTVGTPYTYVTSKWVYASRYTATSSATINHINVRSYGTGNMKVAIYSDSYNAVGTLIAGGTGSGAVTAGLNSIPLDSPVTITSGTTYWLAEWSDAPVFAFTAEPGIYANSSSAYTSIDFSTTTISWRYPTPGNFRGLISGSN